MIKIEHRLFAIHGLQSLKTTVSMAVPKTEDETEYIAGQLQDAKIRTA